MLVLLAFASAHAQVNDGTWSVVSTTSSTGVEHLVAARTVDASAYGYATARTELDCILDEVEVDCAVRVAATTATGASVVLTPSGGGALRVDRASGDVTYAAAGVPAGIARDLLEEQLVAAAGVCIPTWWGICHGWPPYSVAPTWTGARYEWALGRFDTTCE